MNMAEDHNIVDNDSYFGVLRLLVITWRELLDNTTLHGFKYLVQTCRSTGESLIWWLIQILAVWGSVWLFLHAWQNFTAQPTFTTLQSVKHPIWEVPFPAVSICSVNKVSKKAARAYAEELANKGHNRSVDWLFDKMKYLGHLIDFDIDSANEYLDFQEILDNYDYDEVTKLYDPTYRMELLAPKCEDVLVRCQWGDGEVDCNEIFSLRKTWEGYCCLFNYIRPFDTLSSSRFDEPLHSSYTGVDSGLILLLNTTKRDYYYPLRNTLGFNVHVFNSREFPDVQTGSFLQLFVNPETEVFFKLDVTTVDAMLAVQQYSPVQRGCLFSHELGKYYGGHYSFADCLLKCKIKNIVALCNCMPYIYPTNFPDGTTSDVKCTLAHNKCLNRYKAMVNTFRPHSTIVEDNIEDSIECPECFPICSKTYYRVTATYSRVLRTAMASSSWPLLKNLSTLSEVSIVHVYNPFIASTLYRTDVVMTWQEIVSNFGGILGLCLGFSLISLVELIYFATVRLYGNIPIAFNLVERRGARSKVIIRQYIERMYTDRMAGYYAYDKDLKSIQ